MRIRKTLAVLWLLWLAGVAIAAMGPAILPERFYFDANTVRELLADEFTPRSQSFVSTAAAYRLLGFTSLWPDALAGPASFTLSLLAVVVGARLAGVRWDPAAFLLLSVWTIPLAVFHGTYSKETFAIAAIAIMLRLSRSASGVVLAAAVALGYAAVFRSYWVVIVALWLVFIAAWRAGLGWPARLTIVMLAIIPLSLASESFAGLWLTDGRTVVVEARAGEPDSATMFGNPLVNTSAITDLLNAIAGWLTLLLPFQLMAFGGVQHVVFALFQFVNTFLFVHVARALPPAPRGRTPTPHQWRTAAAAGWCIAYTIVQGMFEPDFGSFVKHESNLVPMLMFLVLGARDAVPEAIRKDMGAASRSG